MCAIRKDNHDLMGFISSRELNARQAFKEMYIFMNPISAWKYVRTEIFEHFLSGQNYELEIQ